MRKYSSKLDTEHTAKAMGINLGISRKHAIEISNFIRMKKTIKAKTVLREIIGMKKPIPFTRFNNDVGHRRGKMASGRYPVKASQQILTLINQVETNAQDKGLDTNSLIIKHMNAHKGETTWHSGRKRRRKMKRTNVEIIVEEIAKKEEKKQPKVKQTKTDEKPKQTPIKLDEKPKQEVKTQK